MRQSETDRVPSGDRMAVYFGAFVKMLRHRHGIRQLQVLAHLPGWTQATYSRVETGEIAPAFDQLATIYAALCHAGVMFTPHDRQQFLTLARLRIEAKRTYLEHKTDHEWDELRLQLSRIHPNDAGDEHATVRQGRSESSPRLVETRHLVGREDWLASVIASLRGPLPKKLVVLQGPVGIGKSSELHRIAQHFLLVETNRPQVLLCDIPSVEREAGPESALDLLLGILLAEISPADASMQMASLTARSTFVLEYLEKSARSFLLLVDNAEQMIDAHGQIAPCWERFLGAFLRSQHHASLVLATREWPGWFEGERIFLSERAVPALSIDDGVAFLQRLGLTTVPVTYLRQVSETVGGVPLCLEWVVSLVQEPMWLDTWEEGDDLDEAEEASGIEEVETKRIVRLLNDVSLFGGPIATKLTPLLNRIIEKRLSAEAAQVLQILAFAAIPLGKPALQHFCPRPHLLKELRAVSLLTAYPNRVQVLPMVAAQIRSHLSHKEQHQCEKQLIEAYERWLNEGKSDVRESGVIVTELTCLYLKHHRLLDAAQLLIQYGWLSFNLGNAPRLARLAQEVTRQADSCIPCDNQYGRILLHYYLSPFLGKDFDPKERKRDYEAIQNAVLAGQVTLPPLVEIHITHRLLLYASNMLLFEEAKAHLEVCHRLLEPFLASNCDIQVSLLEECALLYGKWCEYAEEQGETQAAKTYRQETISFYRQCSQVLLTVLNDEMVPLKKGSLKKRLALSYINLCYQLNRDGQHEEALRIVDQCIVLKEQGYTQYGALASAYGEKSQILAALGFFREALLYDEKALTEVQSFADKGHRPSQEEVWIYRVNRGSLYLLLGKMQEAEQLLREALPHIHPRRRVYRMFAQEGLNEIEQWRRQTSSSRHQLDWRWIERYRELEAYDAYWWWAQAGPFTEDEQHLWDQLYRPEVDETTKERLGVLIAQSRQRELAAALAEHRAPYFSYPALNIAEVRSCIAAMQQLDSEIQQQEANAIVRRLYHGAIEDEITFLRLIEATYERNTRRFWTLSQSLNPVPTPEEMHIAFTGMKKVIHQGLSQPALRDVSTQCIRLLEEQFHLALEMRPDEETQVLQQAQEKAPAQSQQWVSARAVQCFFESLLQQNGYTAWTVEIDPKTSGLRVETGLRCLFLPDTPLSLERIEHYVSHELAGHVLRAVNGENSIFGLLSMNTKDYMPTEEGLALYQERQVLHSQGHAFDDSVAWMGTLAVGLASGVMTPPQTFLSLYAFFEVFHLLSRLIDHLDADRQTAEEKARRAAFSTCLRTYRGVPDLTQPGICYTKDVVYLRGLRLIEQAVAQDAAILDKLAVGKVALALLPDIEQLGIVAPPSSLRNFTSLPDLGTHVLSFEERVENLSKDA